jgi:hypothetical protein
MEINGKTLTTCGIVDEGKGVTLNFLDHADAPVTLRLSLEQAQSVAMTLPHLLSHAVRKTSGDPQSRYVFPLGGWLVELPEDGSGLILTLKTPDGFQTSFVVATAIGRALGAALADERADRQDADESSAELRLN